MSKELEDRVAVDDSKRWTAYSNVCSLVTGGSLASIMIAENWEQVGACGMVAAVFLGLSLRVGMNAYERYGEYLENPRKYMQKYHPHD